MRLQALLEHFRIADRVQREKRGSEASAESRLGLGDTGLSPGYLGRVPGQEVIHRLVRCEPADGRQYAKGIAGEEEDIARMVAASRRLAVVNEIDRISRAGVFRDTLVVEQRPMRMRIDDHVFQHTAETDRVPDLRLALT